MTVIFSVGVILCAHSRSFFFSQHCVFARKRSFTIITGDIRRRRSTHNLVITITITIITIIITHIINHQFEIMRTAARRRRCAIVYNGRRVTVTPCFCDVHVITLSSAFSGGGANLIRRHSQRPVRRSVVSPLRRVKK